MLIVLLVSAAWSLWAATQTNINTAAAEVKTNQPAGSTSETKEPEQRYLTFGLDKLPVLRDFHFLGEPLWKYLASLIYIFLAFYIAKIFDLIAFVWLKKFAEKTETKVDDLLLDLLRGPIKIIVFVIFLHIGLNVFDWSHSAKLYLSKGSILVVAASLTYLTLKVIDMLLDVWRLQTLQRPAIFCHPQKP